MKHFSETSDGVDGEDRAPMWIHIPIASVNPLNANQPTPMKDLHLPSRMHIIIESVIKADQTANHIGSSGHTTGFRF